MLPVMKTDYNKLLAKVTAQEKWLDENRSDKRHSNLLQEYICNTEKLNDLLVLIEKTFKTATNEEVKHGF